jgi:hypothetical protein
MKFSKLFIVALIGLFFLLSFNLMQEAKPSKKNERIYSKVKPYIPYYLEKRLGGFSILSKEDNVKEKPPIDKVFSRLEQLEQGWGMTHLQIINNKLIIKDNNGKQIDSIQIKTLEEQKWINQYFNLDHHIKVQ